MQAVERTLQVLSAVASQSEPTTLIELSRSTGLSMSTLHRYVHQLIDLGYLRTSDDKLISVGPMTLALGSSAMGSDAMVARMGPVLRELGRATGATSFVGQLVGDQVICTAMERGTNPLHLTVRIGQLIPPLHAAAARSVLAFESPDTVEAVWRSGGSMDEAELERFRELLGGVCERGYDICDSELDDGVWAVAAPIRGKPGDRVSGSVAVAGPQSLFASDSAVAAAIDLVIAASIDLSAGQS